MSKIKDETITGAKWRILQKFTMQPLQMIYGIILARLITTNEMGVLALAGIFFAIAGTLKDAGIGQALIRKQYETEEDINTVFWFNIASNAVFGGAFYLAAPWIADIFNEPALIWLTRISAIMMFVTSSAGVHWTLYTKRKDFKTPAIIGTITTMIGMPITVYLAYTGWSYWSIVISGIVTNLLGLIIVWIISPWKPRFIFSWTSFKEFFAFGSRLAVSGLLDTGYSNIHSFIIGSFYSTASLGLYNRGAQLAMVPVSTVSGILGQITYPILASIQDDETRLINAYRKYIKVSSLGIFFAVISLAALAEPFVRSPILCPQLDHPTRLCST